MRAWTGLSAQLQRLVLAQDIGRPIIGTYGAVRADYFVERRP